MMNEYVWAVQDRDGREIIAWRGRVAKVSDARAVADGATVRLVVDGTARAAGPYNGDVSDLTLYRWPGRDRLADPVSHKVGTE
jgi:hypothetical protein